MNIPSVATKLVALLGNPLSHSISPAMHNRVFQKLGMDYLYLPVEVAPQNLQTVFAGLSRMNVGGFNVTIPHKIAIMELLDELDPLAETIGAVNTICIEDGKTKGYNTDGYGFIRSLTEESGISVAGSRFLLLGAGGAARAIAMTLASRGAEKIFICNRTVSSALSLVNEINTKITPCAEVVEQEHGEQATAIRSCNVLINTTSIGMTPMAEQIPIDASLLFQDLIVADIVYNPLTTRLLRSAESIGCSTVPGLGMLIYQGAAAFTLWTGLEPLVAEMSEVAHTLMATKQ